MWLDVAPFLRMLVREKEEGPKKDYINSHLPLVSGGMLNEQQVRHVDDRRQRHQGIPTCFDAMLWLFPFSTMDAWIVAPYGVSVHAWHSLAFALFIGDEYGYIQTSTVCRRFLWLREIWCIDCTAWRRGQYQASGTAPWDFAEVRMCLPDSYVFCRDCNRRHGLSDADLPWYECSHCGTLHTDPEAHAVECVYAGWSD